MRKQTANIIRQMLIPNMETTKMSFRLNFDTITRATNEEISNVKATMIEAMFGSTEVRDI